MAAQYVPPTTRVRPSRVRHITTDRLAARHAWLINNRAAIARAADGRPALRDYALQVHTIAGELARRQGA